MMLGKILLQENLISPDQLEHALSEQTSSNARLGELLIEKNIISPQQLEQILEKQYWQKNGFWLIS
ncbi:MAG: hypothetical protein H0U45_06860 [Tatlockia sp.]|nr:hypothetical protein [Tatlockia sp.]